MLHAKDVIATIAVKDLQTARKFYKDKLGLAAIESDGKNYVSYKAGSHSVLVYQSEFAGGYKATVATWMVGDDLENIVKALKAKGISFEHYDLPQTKLEGDIHVSGEMKNAWFTDPDGNIICLVNVPAPRRP